ncbi:alpha/beta fold hydrolase [Kribbella antibiotica]|uniref:Alpha/beta fold hydrolase n=1 Tax=Kribbella antibiotica TaxID=190195 RepID=A0A4R4ZTB8_9ACTN|nr:alpha/beta fold hydrolase [Kribbella antibiotica]TDD60272.1 alpha/beta fold hydrolase [Kribbella antibiotica]
MNKLRISAAVAISLSLVAVIAPTATGQVAKAAPPPVAKYTGQKLAWQKCSFDTGGVKTLCALMTVPRDWANPAAGPDLKVYVSKVVATGDKDDYQGVLLTNPGGPGGQGTSLASDIAGLQPALNAKYDILGMDPRGTGQSGAKGAAGLGITCDVPVSRLPKGPLDARDRSAKSIADHQQTPRAIAEACQSLAVSPYITTWQTAHDMDLIRQLSKATKLNYVGYSYGTWLGAKYASLFPTTTGRMVLDSSIDWQGRLQAGFEDFPRIGQRQTDTAFLGWLNRAQPDVFGKTPASARKVIEAGRSKAVAAGLDPDSYDALFAGNGSPIGWIFTLLALVAITSPEKEVPAKIAALPAAVRAQADRVSLERLGVRAAKVTTKVLVAKRLGEGEQESDYVQLPLTRFAVACNDQPTKTTGWYKQLSDRQGPKYKDFGWQYGLSEACGPWTDEPLQKLPNLPASVQKNVLLVQGELDPQTAYEQAMAAASKAPGISVLRVDDSPFHGQYATQDNPCVDGVINTYLLHGSTTPNSICPSVPLLGDTKVYPVRGPVDAFLNANKRSAKSLAAPKASTTTDDQARRDLADRISQENDILPLR